MSNFSLEFELSTTEIRELNKMYFKNLFKERISAFFGILLLTCIFFDFLNINNRTDLTIWIIRNVILVAVFLLFQYSFVKVVCRLVFKIVKKLLKFENFISKYRFNFNNSFINVCSPLGEFTYRWNRIEKAILTKDFLFLYVKEKNGYIISISNKIKNDRNMEELIDFVDKNVTQIIKV
jgi:hypothetical protein